MAYNPETDSLTNAITTMQLAHSKIHDGRMFGDLKQLTLGIGVTQAIVIDVPAGYAFHILYGFLVDAATRIRIYDDPTNITRALQVYLPNKNRNTSRLPPLGFEMWALNPFPGPGTLFYDVTLIPGLWFIIARKEDELVFGSNTGAARSHVVTWTAGVGAVNGIISSCGYFVENTGA